MTSFDLGNPIFMFWNFSEERERKLFFLSFFLLDSLSLFDSKYFLVFQTPAVSKGLIFLRKKRENLEIQIRIIVQAEFGGFTKLRSNFHIFLFLSKYRHAAISLFCRMWPIIFGVQLFKTLRKKSYFDPKCINLVMDLSNPSKD